MSQDSRLRLARATQSYWGDRAAWVTVSAGMWTACVKMLSADKDTHVSNIYRERALSLVIFALITCWNDNILAILVKETRFFLSWRRKNSVRGKVVDEKRLIRMGCFGGLPVGRQEGALPWELNGLQFYSQRKSGKGQRRPSLSFWSWHHVFIINSFPRLNRGVFLSLSFQVRSKYCFYVCREHVLGITNLLSSLGTMYVSCHHCFIVLGHALCFCYMVLLLSKPAWFCG